MPLFDNDWEQCKNFFIHADQAAVFVVVIDIIEFINQMIHKLQFFISYEIKFEERNARMLLEAGEIDVNSKTLYEGESRTISRSEVYKDLLAISSTSSMLLLTVKFQKQPKIKFQNFLKESLKFSQLQDDEDRNETLLNDEAKSCNIERMEIDSQENDFEGKSFIFYCDENYFKGVLVRLKFIDQLSIRIKLYIKSSHQIVTFVKSIYGKYSERCTIDVKKSREFNQETCNLITQINTDDIS
ncbi:CLUMA_CG019588, isoform A [Clunio marinus]|uniref:CLUMA_CG019588, isoform A n=1 Tax=Clunio marinus TaxID=568069 RepID=A0A1J1J3H0_9DIPT|nr:CLUMA_CG019588, isoform A [Clunio marinus]